MAKSTATNKPINLERQVTFALASTLTAVAKEAQKEIIRDVQSTFTVRGNWLTPSNKFGIKVRPAKKTNLVAEVGTAADWLTPHESGGTKLPSGKHIAIPTINVRRTKRQLIQKAQRPGALRGKRDVVIKTRSGLTLFQRQGRGATARLVPLYRLEPKATIRKQSTVFEPTERVISKRFGAVFHNQLQRAFATTKK